MALNKPVEQPSKETILSVLKAADRIRRHFTEILKPFGLTLQQFNVLRILRGAGPQGLPTLEVGERMIEKTPGATRLLDRLEEKG
ncbi:MAG: MarR family transcriptional regulator, partial [Thermoanaerobaculia bacterium]